MKKSGIMHLEQLIVTLKKRREVLGVTQEHLAELSGVGLRTLKALESGKSNPTFETLSKLADVLGMELKMEVKKPKY
jgi:transcriptional regulator with XRE-family HTH domain